MFHLPQPDAAKALGISLTTLKQVCRRHGMFRWPYRRPCKRPSSRVHVFTDGTAESVFPGPGMPLQGNVPAKLEPASRAGEKGAASNGIPNRMTSEAVDIPVKQNKGLPGADLASGSAFRGLEAPQQRAHSGFQNFTPVFGSAGNTGNSAGHAGLQDGPTIARGPHDHQFAFQGDFGWPAVGSRAEPSSWTQRMPMGVPDQGFNGSNLPLGGQMFAGQMMGTNIALNNMQGSHAQSDALQHHDGMNIMSRHHVGGDSQFFQQQPQAHFQIPHHRMATGLWSGGMGYQSMGAFGMGSLERYDGLWHGFTSEREWMLMQSSGWGGGGCGNESYAPSAFNTEYSNGIRAGPDYESDPSGNLNGMHGFHAS